MRVEEGAGEQGVDVDAGGWPEEKVAVCCGGANYCTAMPATHLARPHPSRRGGGGGGRGRLTAEIKRSATARNYAAIILRRPRLCLDINAWDGHNGLALALQFLQLSAHEQFAKEQKIYDFSSSTCILVGGN
ncbi:Protein of unknown function [Gryllus bimaculatus]|nr:Protein of unknown function [Gryllus bimaculatus]